MSKDIFECARTNDVLGLTRILETGVDVNSRTRNNETPLHFACIARAYEAAVALISSGADVRIRTRHFLETPLHFAVQEGHVPTITLLLDAGADLTVPVLLELSERVLPKSVQDACQDIHDCHIL